MSDDASPYPVTDSPSGQLGPSYSTLWVGLFIAALLAFGVYQVLVLPVASTSFTIWGVLVNVLSLTLYVPAVWWRDTVVWFEWKDGVLRYRLAGRSAVHSLLQPEITQVRPIRWPATAEGFLVVAGCTLRFEYDRAGNAVRLRDILTVRLRDDRLPGHSPPR